MSASSTNQMYSPVLRWKAGERNALAGLAARSAEIVLPVIEPTPQAYEHANGRAKALRAEVRKAARTIETAWAHRDFYYDTHLIDGLGWDHPSTPLIALGEEIQALGLAGRAILRIEQSPETWRHVVDDSGPGPIVGLRVRARDLSSTAGQARLRGLIKESGLAPNAAHLFVDLGVIRAATAPLPTALAVPHLGPWHRVTLIAGSFPRDLTHLEPGIHHLPRLEWGLYLDTLATWARDLGPVAFGDFGTQHAEFYEPAKPCYPSISARYALETEWLVLRGYSLKKKEYGGFGQFYGHAKVLTRSAGFFGHEFSGGDAYIAQRLSQGATTGNLTTWLSASMSQHLTLTGVQLESIDWSALRDGRAVTQEIGLVQHRRRVDLPNQPNPRAG